MISARHYAGSDVLPTTGTGCDLDFEQGCPSAQNGRSKTACTAAQRSGMRWNTDGGKRDFPLGSPEPAIRPRVDICRMGQRHVTSGRQRSPKGRLMRVNLGPAAAAVWATRPDCAQTTEPRRWKDLALMGPIVLWMPRRRFSVSTHGRVQEEKPWATAYARISRAWSGASAPARGRGQILLLPTSTLSNLPPGHYAGASRDPRPDHRGRRDLLASRKLAVYDLDRARVLWIGPGKGRDRR